MPDLISGVDVIEVSRLQSAIDRYGERFLKRIFTSIELEQVGHQPASLAGRFAAKEAVAKAFGQGIGQISWLDIEILRGEKKEPVLVLHGYAKQLAEQMDIHGWSVSLSHTQHLAIAQVVALRG